MASDSDDETENMHHNQTSTAFIEIFIMLKLAVPVSITSISDIVMLNTDRIFLGHLGTTELAAAAVADNCLETLRYFVDTLGWSLLAICSQALGIGNSFLVGYWFQIAIMLCILVSIPCSIAYFYSYIFIELINNDPELIQNATKFAHYAVLFLLLNGIMICITSLHQSLEIVKPFTIISIIAIIINIIGNQLWIYGLNIGIVNISFNGLGFIGSPLATTTSMIFQLLMYCIWCFIIKKYHLKHSIWNGFSLKETIFHKKRIWEFVKIWTPITLGHASENWGYQVVNLYAATLNPTQIAALSCTYGIWNILWTFYNGIGQATVTRIGKKIGAGHVKEAKLVAKISLILSLISCSTIALIIFSFSDKIPMIYSKDKRVHHVMTECVRSLCVLFVIGAIGWCALNILEGLSRNKAKGMINAAFSWLGYVPICIFFLSNGNSERIIGVSGVSSIFVVGIVIEMMRASVLWVMILRIDWKECCIEASKRNECDINDDGVERQQLMALDDGDGLDDRSDVNEISQDELVRNT